MNVGRCPECAEELICPKCQSIEAIGAKLENKESGSYDVVLAEVIGLLRKRGLSENDIVRVGMAIAGGAIGTISKDRAMLEENLKRFTEVLTKAARDVFSDPEEN